MVHFFYHKHHHVDSTSFLAKPEDVQAVRGNEMFKGCYNCIHAKKSGFGEKFGKKYHSWDELINKVNNKAQPTSNFSSLVKAKLKKYVHKTGCAEQTSCMVLRNEVPGSFMISFASGNERSKMVNGFL